MHGRKSPRGREDPRPPLLEQLRTRRTETRKQADALLERATTETRDLTPEEAAEFAKFVAAERDLDSQLDKIRDDEIRELRAAAARQLEQATAEPDKPPLWPFPLQTRARGQAQVTDPPVYHRDGRDSWVRDVLNATVNPAGFDARDRLARHERQVAETRAMTSYQPANSLTAGGALTPPQWLISELATVARAGRPLADAIGSQPLPLGIDQLMVPTASQGSLTGAQATENTAIAAQDWVTAQLTSGITTLAGQVDISQQLLDQSPANVDQIILGDLLQDLAFQVDSEVVNGTGASGQISGLVTVTPGTTVTFTSAAPAYTSATTANSFVFQVAKAINGVATVRKRGAQVIVMHPRRWAWITTALDSQNRPMVVPETAVNAYGRLSNVAAEAVVGTQSGLPVMLDQSIPTTVGTNQDVVFVLRLDDMRLWESAPVARAMVQPLSATLGIRLQVFGYLAGILNRYAGAIAKITGTGLVDPGL